MGLSRPTGFNGIAICSQPDTRPPACAGRFRRDRHDYDFYPGKSGVCRRRIQFGTDTAQGCRPDRLLHYIFLEHRCRSHFLSADIHLRAYDCGLLQHACVATRIACARLNTYTQRHNLNPDYTSSEKPLICQPGGHRYHFIFARRSHSRSNGSLRARHMEPGRDDAFDERNQDNNVLLRDRMAPFS